MTQAPVSTLGPPGSATPAGSQTPIGGPTAALEPLPVPTLADGFEVGQSLYDPTATGNAVMSLLSLMGVEVRTANGAVLLPGVENGAGPLQLTEAEARGLIEMTREDLAEHPELTGLPTIADLYDALAPSLPGSSVDQLASGYDRAYQANPESLAAQVMLGQPITPETPLLRVQWWLLLIDAFAPPPSTAALVKFVTAAVRPRLGTARGYQPPVRSPIPGMSDSQWAELVVRLPTLAFRVSFHVDVSGVAHEGHGGLGARVDFIATVETPDPVVASDGTTILLQAGLAPGLTMTWDSHDLATLTNHGTLGGSTRTPVTFDTSGTARIAYTPKKEVANGQGVVVREVSDFGAFADQYSLVAKAYSLGAVDPFARKLIKGRRRADGEHFEIAWHEREYIALGILNVYEFTIGAPIHLLSIYRKGRDTTLGVLYRVSDGVYRGTATVTTDSIAVGEAFLGLAGKASCHDTLRSGQQLAVDANVTGGKLLLHFYPASGPTMQGVESEDPLAGIGGRFPPCQQTIPFNGNARYPAGDYAPINDTRWSTATGYAFSMPDVGQRLTVTDNAQVGAANQVCSVFYIVAYRSDPKANPAPTAPPMDPAPVPGTCDQTSPP